MDPATAKTLVSALTVFSIVVFSLLSFEMAFTAMAKDLKAIWTKRAAEGAKKRVTPSSAT